jgi:hypothetical protein
MFHIEVKNFVCKPEFPVFSQKNIMITTEDVNGRGWEWMQENKFGFNGLHAVNANICLNQETN